MSDQNVVKEGWVQKRGEEEFSCFQLHPNVHVLDISPNQLVNFKISSDE